MRTEIRSTQTPYMPPVDRAASQRRACSGAGLEASWANVSQPPGRSSPMTEAAHVSVTLSRHTNSIGGCEPSRAREWPSAISSLRWPWKGPRPISSVSGRIWDCWRCVSREARSMSSREQSRRILGWAGLGKRQSRRRAGRSNMYIHAL